MYWYLLGLSLSFEARSWQNLETPGVLHAEYTQQAYLTSQPQHPPSHARLTIPARKSTTSTRRHYVNAAVVDTKTTPKQISVNLLFICLLFSNFVKVVLGIDHIIIWLL